LSFPRINPVTSSFKIPNPVTDKEMIHLISVMRIYLDDVPFFISTRERADFRDKLVELAVTHISAGSKTTPGGYAIKTEAQGQFDVSDKRELKEMISIIRTKGYDPVIKDWDVNFMGVFGDYNG
ncbi:MAG TPA: 2-iminoacetate synthase ThiH, partial [Spirochaetota bacterium]|nr:2-iminoacetate synthase ThiH [Spirochaetota bacterium]